MADLFSKLSRGTDAKTPIPRFDFATVAGVYSDGLSLIFPGQTEPTTKHYKRNARLTFKVGDRVKVFYTSGTYIVEYPII